MTCRAVIIDDNPSMRANNRLLIDRNFPDIDIIGESSSVSEGVKLINHEKPDLVLLDIELEDGTGFDILQKVDHNSFSLIFIQLLTTMQLKL